MDEIPTNLVRVLYFTIEVAIVIFAGYIGYSRAGNNNPILVSVVVASLAAGFLPLYLEFLDRRHSRKHAH